MIWHNHSSVQVANLLPFSFRQDSRTIVLASSGSIQRWSVVKVMKIGRLSF